MVDKTTDGQGENLHGTSEVTDKTPSNTKGCEDESKESNSKSSADSSNTNDTLANVKTEENPEEKDEQITDPDNPLLQGPTDIRDRIEAFHEKQLIRQQEAKKKAEQNASESTEKFYKGKFLHPIFDEGGEIIGYQNALHIGHLDLKVGEVHKVKKHPHRSKQSSYTEVVTIHPFREDKKKLDKAMFGPFQDLEKIKEEMNLVIESGINKHYDITDLWRQKVIVVCNVKPFNSRGVDSRVVVLCARKGKKTELLQAPSDAIPGDTLVVKGFLKKPVTPYVLNISKHIEPDLRVNKDRQLVYKDTPVKVENKEGFITTRTLSDCGVTNVMGYDFI